MSSRHRKDSRPTEQQLKDEAFLASLGYRQELKRDFSGIELFGLSFSLIGEFSERVIYL